MLFFAMCYGPVLTAVGGSFVPGWGPALFDGGGDLECVPGVGMIIGS